MKNRSKSLKNTCNQPYFIVYLIVVRSEAHHIVNFTHPAQGGCRDSLT